MLCTFWESYWRLNLIQSSLFLLYTVKSGLMAEVWALKITSFAHLWTVFLLTCMCIAMLLKLPLLYTGMLVSKVRSRGFKILGFSVFLPDIEWITAHAAYCCFADLHSLETVCLEMLNFKVASCCFPLSLWFSIDAAFKHKLHHHFLQRGEFFLLGHFLLFSNLNSCL